MSRRRMIDPNFWDSEDVSRLSIMERLLLIGLFSNADDYGKGRGNLTTIRSKIFPNDDFSLKDIEKAIKNIKKNINILFYEVENNQYYKFTKWSHWQRVDKPQPSTIPEPSDSENDSKNDSENDYFSENDSNNCYENDSKNDYRLKEYKGKENNIKESEINKFFDSVWDFYPVKKGKQSVSDKQKKILYEIGYDELKRCFDRYESSKESWKAYQQGSTFFNSGYFDYLDKNYVQQSTIEEMSGVIKTEGGIQFT